MQKNTRNALNWFEISVKDVKQAAAFYATVTGKPLEQVEHDGVKHAIFGAGPNSLHGALIENPKRPPAAGGTVIYFDIPDGVERALARAREAGGTIVQPLTDLGQHGTCALISDRDGNLIGLHTEKV